MKIQIFTVVILLLTFEGALAQFLWAKQIGGTNGNAVVLQTSQLGLIIVTTGYFTGEVDFDPGPGVSSLQSYGGKDIFVCYWDNLGNFIWAKQFGGLLDDEAHDLIQISNNDIIIAGSFEGSANFDALPNITTLVSAGSKDAFVACYSNTGVLKWYNQLGGSGFDEINGLTYITQFAWINGPKMFAVGSFENSMQLNTPTGLINMVSNGARDIFVADLDSVVHKAKSIGGLGNDEGKDITIYPWPTILLCGSFEDSVDFDPGIGVAQKASAGGSDIFRLELTMDFIFDDIATIGGTGEDAALSITSSGFTSGYFSDTVAFNPFVGGINQRISAGGKDFFALRFNPNGIVTWAFTSGGTGDDIAYSVTQDGGNGVYIAGKFTGTCDFDPSNFSTYPLESAGGSDIFLVKLDGSGGYIWSKKMGGPFNDAAHCVRVPSFNLIYMGGMFSDTSDFNGGPGIYNMVAQGNTDGFLTRYVECGGMYSTQVFNGCDSLTINGTTFYNNNFVNNFYSDVNGCDSNVVYDIQIHPTYYINQTLTVCDSIIIANQTLNATGIYTLNLTSTWGCDSTIIVDLTVNQMSLGSVSQTACDSYTLNGQTYTASGVYTQNFTNAAGCDSMLTLILTINHSSSSILNQSACGSFPYNGQTYYNSGTFIHTFTNAAGCDSLVTLNLIINPIYAISISHTACDSYTWNGQTYSTSGAYTQNYSSVSGCDSIMTLNLTINSVNTGITQSGATFTATASGALYQWLSCNPYQVIPGETNQTFTATANGDYAVIVTQSGCSDTSACLSVNGLGIEEFHDNTIRIFPNPVLQELSITSQQILNHASILILSAEGKVVLKKMDASGKTIVLDMSHLARGIYFVEIESEGMKYVRRVLKE